MRYACDNRVTIVTKFPFMGGSLGGVCDLLVQHADSLLRLHFSRYQEMHTFCERLGHVVDTGKRSKSADRSVARKLWVVIWVVDDCTIHVTANLRPCVCEGKSWSALTSIQQSPNFVCLLPRTCHVILALLYLTKRNITTVYRPAIVRTTLTTAPV